MSWRIEVDGKYQYDAVMDHTSEQLNDHEEAIFYLPNTDLNRDTVSANVDVSIYYMGNLIYFGTLLGIDYEKTQITCQVYNKAYDLLNKKDIDKPTEYLEGVAANVIFADVVAACGGISAGVCPTDTISIKFFKTICYDAVSFLSDSTNKDFWTTLGTTTVNIGTRGSDKGRINVTNIGKRGINRYKKRDKVQIRGVDINGVAIVGSAGTGIDVANFTEKKASDVPTLNNIAAKKLTELNKDSSGVNITCNLNETFDVFPGDTVTIIDAEYNLNGSYRVWKISKKVDGTTELEVDKQEQLLQRFLEKQQNLEDIGIYTPTTNEILDNPAGPPATPSGLTATDGTFSVKLGWSANTEADLQRYYIYRNTTFASGASSIISEIDSTFYEDFPPASETYYYYWIRAVDRVGNVSPYYPLGAPGISGKSQLVKTINISNATITELKIAASSISHNRLQVNSIYGSVLSAASITRQKLGVDAITSGVVMASQILSRNLVAGSITTEKILSNAIVSAKIAAGEILSINIGASQILSNKIAASQILGLHVVAGAIDTLKLTTNAIYAKDFRTASGVGRTGAPTGIRFYSSGIVLYAGGSTESRRYVSQSISKNQDVRFG